MSDRVNQKVNELRDKAGMDFGPLEEKCNALVGDSTNNVYSPTAFSEDEVNALMSIIDDNWMKFQKMGDYIFNLVDKYRFDDPHYLFLNQENPDISNFLNYVASTLVENPKDVIEEVSPSDPFEVPIYDEFSGGYERDDDDEFNNLMDVKNTISKYYLSSPAKSDRMTNKLKQILGKDFDKDFKRLLEEDDDYFVENKNSQKIKKFLDKLKIVEGVIGSFAEPKLREGWAVVDQNDSVLEGPFETKSEAKKVSKEYFNSSVKYVENGIVIFAEPEVRYVALIYKDYLDEPIEREFPSEAELLNWYNSLSDCDKKSVKLLDEPKIIQTACEGLNSGGMPTMNYQTINVDNHTLLSESDNPKSSYLKDVASIIALSHLASRNSRSFLNTVSELGEFNENIYNLLKEKYPDMSKDELTALIYFGMFRYLARNIEEFRNPIHDDIRRFTTTFSKYNLQNVLGLTSPQFERFDRYINKLM